MASKFSFTSPEVEKLAHLVEANPVLYYTLDENYKNISLRDNIWKEISLEIEESGKAYNIYILIYYISISLTKNVGTYLYKY